MNCWNDHLVRDASGPVVPIEMIVAVAQTAVLNDYIYPFITLLYLSIINEIDMYERKVSVSARAPADEWIKYRKTKPRKKSATDADQQRAE